MHFAIYPFIKTPEQLIEELTAKVASLEAELAIQKSIVAELLKKLYGAKSEKLDHNQLLMLFLNEEAKKPVAAAPEDQGPAAEPKPRARRTNKLSDSLKSLPTIVREIVHPEVLAAPEEFRLIGEETSERLHVKPTAFTLEIIKRLTHVRRNEVDAVPVTAPLEPCLLPGSVLTPSLGAYLFTQKFCYHSPFYREQWKLKATHGIEMSRNLMCYWHGKNGVSVQKLTKCPSCLRIPSLLEEVLQFHRQLSIRFRSIKPAQLLAHVRRAAHRQFFGNPLLRNRRPFPKQLSEC